jgi:pSer/pThr/pTyr-binding forkhead associated (FHA) protein
MTTLAPVSVALKFGFLAVLYLFVLWVARSARRDLRGRDGALVAERGSEAQAPPADATGLHSASAAAGADVAHRSPQLVVARAPGHDSGMIYDIDGDLVLGRGDRAEIRLEDPFASSRHARVYEQGNIVVIEDLGSTNGTYLNEEVLQSPRPLHPGDRVRIGDSEFTFEVD